GRLNPASTPSTISLVPHDTAPTAIYTLSLHDALPILLQQLGLVAPKGDDIRETVAVLRALRSELGPDVPSASNPAKQLALRLHGDRKSTRLNSSHVKISYAVFCLKKKKNGTQIDGAAG